MAVQLNIQFSQGSAATDLRWGAQFYYTGFWQFIWTCDSERINTLLQESRAVVGKPCDTAINFEWYTECARIGRITHLSQPENLCDAARRSLYGSAWRSTVTLNFHRLTSKFAKSICVSNCTNTVCLVKIRLVLFKIER